ncbi:MAG: YidH family protein [Arthrobacter sp.]|uniref:YidH family protein n=1 Tax=Arthrobacter TaxID=1663 RepID=UPI00265057F3|nr:DUF202 domain-containing protein [Micrococcaceae bacterium]MDN5812744.1 DUF202 domain-containing protein [Micrococcaceae bacterium]MDN5822716.1 DUF202 domain-containing protein [Micrococcaceae bacterium]MDN5878180.1 DUF202 domain-containing protein [Micrococcaceae bacterium]MDN5886707.1 DUF202 domain-containing protein [Micrococcaceae bacterium]
MADEGERGWLARKALPSGNEPDPRFTLANERTFLAWIRTSLAFLAGGIALEAFAFDAFPTDLRKAISILVICLGLLISAGAVFRWLRIESSMRNHRPLPFPAIVPLLGIGGALAAAVIVVVLVVSG